MTAVSCRALAALLLTLAMPPTLAAQSGFVPLRADAVAVPLSNPVTVSASNVPLGDVIRDIVQQAGLSVAIDEALPGLGRRVSLQLTGVSAAAALVHALQDTSLQAMVSPTGQVVIVARPGRRPRPAILRGLIHETGSAEPVAGARVELTGTAFAAISREDGSFSFGRVPVGEYRARFTRMGFRPLSLQHVSVSESVEGHADEPMAVSMERAAVPFSAVVVTPGYFGVWGLHGSSSAGPRRA